MIRGFGIRAAELLKQLRGSRESHPRKLLTAARRRASPPLVQSELVTDHLQFLQNTRGSRGAQWFCQAVAGAIPR
jgi:hypothetical protein